MEITSTNLHVHGGIHDSSTTNLGIIVDATNANAVSIHSESTEPGDIPAGFLESLQRCYSELSSAQDQSRESAYACQQVLLAIEEAKEDEPDTTRLAGLLRKVQAVATSTKSLSAAATAVGALIDSLTNMAT